MTAQPAGPLYHGTKYSLQPGQEMTADGARRADPAYPGHIRHVWVTTAVLAAATHATKHGRDYWDQGHVYEVEPIRSRDLEPDPLDNGSRASWRSRTGFRVVRRVGSPAELLMPPARPVREERQRATRGRSL